MLQRLGLRVPIFQAPMAGVSTPALAAAVSNAGGLGALGLGAAQPDDARAMIARFRALSSGPLHVNVFCHAPAPRDPAQEAAWLDRMAPLFRRFGAAAPSELGEIYQSFRQDGAMLEVLCDTCPELVSFHFGLPLGGQLDALKRRGILTMASATSPGEARLIAEAGVDIVVAQGWEAGGHRGIFAPDGPDARLGTHELLSAIAAEGLPVVAAGGLMDGADIRGALSAGAVAAQLGTAFISCPESAADAGYRAALADSGASTRMVRAVSGRPARCLVNAFTRWAEDAPEGEIPAYPVAYDAGKALNAAAKSAGETGFGAQWAGQGARRVRALPAADLMALLEAELRA